MYNFSQPQWFFLIILIPLLIWYDLYVFKKKTPKITFSNLELLKLVQKRNSFLRYLPVVLKSLILFFIIVALARPRFTLERREHTTYGIDIILSIDVSGSMKAIDFKPMNRMEAAKKVALDFVQKRENDRIGIVTFASYAYTLTPLTTDFNVLNTIISNIEIDEDQSGTAIGNGIAIATARLKDSQAESKVIILLTDGVNNAGQIDPLTAAELAKAFDIKIYAVGVGSTGPVDFPFHHPIYGTTNRKVNIDLDIDVLNSIAQMTGTGRAAIASNTEQLQEIFDEIGRLEKTEIKANVYYEHKELFVYFLYLAVFFVFLFVLTKTVFRISLP